jgi:hypothetical protein
MKTFFLSISFLIVLVLGVNAQSKLKIYTELPDESAKFLVFLNGEKQDAIPMNEIEIEDLQEGQYEMRVVFNGDSISDYVKKIKIPANSVLTYKVVKKGDFGRESGNMGRAIGRTTGTTEEDEKKGLKDLYRLEKVK